MLKLTHEDGHIVLRTLKGQLVWSKHCVDISRDDAGPPAWNIFIEGELIEECLPLKVKRKIKL